MTAVQSATINGTTVRWWEFGAPDQPPLMMLHGFRGNHRGLIDLAEQITDRRIIVPDLPGWGESGKLHTKHEFLAYIAFLRQFAVSLNIVPFDLFGHSFGASLALVFASYHSDLLRQLILLAPVVDAKTVTSRIGEAYYQVGAKLPPPLNKKWVTSAALNRISTELLTTTRDPILKRRIVRDEQDNLKYIDHRVETETFLDFYRVDFMAAAAKITAPTTLIIGDRDQMTSLPIARRLVNAIPNSRLELIPGAGHFLQVEEPIAVAGIINHQPVNLPTS
jgi:pimeloyl-ACP methyl ester carboxylesterase